MHVFSTLDGDINLYFKLKEEKEKYIFAAIELQKITKSSKNLKKNEKKILAKKMEK